MFPLSTEAQLAVYDWHWHPDPGVIDGVFVLSILYALAVGPARRYLAPQESISRWQILSFVTAQILLFLAIASPLDQISEQYLFSAHMLQHVILIYPVPLFWLWGTPAWIWRIPLQMEALAPLVRLVTKPQVAFLLFNLTFYVWHLPPMYEWALRDSKVHFLEHATFMAGAVLLWWPLVQPLKELPRFHPGGQLLFLLAGSIAQIPLFGMLVFSHGALYPTYRNAPRLFADIDAMGDQQLGAAIMKITAMLVMFISLAVIILRWYYIEERSGKAKRQANLAA
jgi:putative membrane protein